MACTNSAAIKTFCEKLCNVNVMVRNEKQKSQAKADCVCVSYVSTFLSDKVLKKFCELQSLCTLLINGANRRLCNAGHEKLLLFSFMTVHGGQIPTTSLRFAKMRRVRFLATWQQGQTMGSL